MPSLGRGIFALKPTVLFWGQPLTIVGGTYMVIVLPVKSADKFLPALVVCKA